MSRRILVLTLFYPSCVSLEINKNLNAPILCMYLTFFYDLMSIMIGTRSKLTSWLSASSSFLMRVSSDSIEVSGNFVSQ